MLPGAGDDVRADVHASIAAYYSRKVAKYGTTPLGVDWASGPTQELRFTQLLGLCDFENPFTLNDVGCGYGALFAYLAQHHRGAEVDYLGTDLSSAMIAHAHWLWQHHHRARFVCGSRSLRVADYSLASGIFNVKLAQPIAAWEHFVTDTLAELHETSRRGFAVNFIAPAAAGEPFVPELYRVAPARWIWHCKRYLDAEVELIDGYGLDEFTLLIRRGHHRISAADRARSFASRGS